MFAIIARIASTRSLCGIVTLAVLLLAKPVVALAAPSCSVSVNTTNFGTYMSTASDTGSTPLTINCSTGTDYDIGLNLGTGSGASGSTREMTGPNAATLAYGLFSDASYTTNWGNSPGVNTVDGAGTGSAQTIPIYAEAAAGQFVAPGTYTDTISILVSGDATASTTMTVTAIVQATCTLSAAPLDFGTYSGTKLDVASYVTVTCTNTTAWSIGLSAGLGSGATVTSRAMTGSDSASLNYALFQDAGHSINWGVTVGTDTESGTGSGSAQQASVYGEIAAGQYVTPGSYSDTIVVTVTY